MKRKITIILLALSLIIFNINGSIYATETGTMVYTENTSRGNIEVYQRISLYKSNVTVKVGNVEEGKILVVSAIPIYGGYATTYISSISISPYAGYSGGWYDDSRMYYFKITQNANYELTITPTSTISSSTFIDIYVYTVDYIDGFVPHNAVEGNSADNYNYVVSNKPEMLG